MFELNRQRKASESSARISWRQSCSSGATDAAVRFAPKIASSEVRQCWLTLD
jgi:hypothetical protein